MTRTLLWVICPIILLPMRNWGEDTPKFEQSGKVSFSNSKKGEIPSLAFNVSQIGGPDIQIAEKIAFQSERDGNFEIYLMDSDDMEQTRLTNNKAGDFTPRWSPDARKIAFMTDRDGNDEIYIMDTDGLSQIRLTNNSASDWFPSWSSDGDKIVFSTDRDGNFEIYVMNTDGSDKIRLTNNNGRDWFPSWSPGGDKIVFSTDRDGNFEIYMMNSDGTGQTRLTDNIASDWSPSWSQDGDKIAFTSRRDGNFEIYMMNEDGSGQNRLTNNTTGDFFPGWSPEGERILFYSSHNGNREIYVTNVDGSDQNRMANNITRESGPSWAGFRGIGSTTVGNSVSRTMAIQNKGNATLTVSNITSSDPKFKVLPKSFSLNAGASRDVRVTFSPTSTGTRYATLMITSNDLDAGVVKLIVNGSSITGVLGDVTGRGGVPDGEVDFRDAVRVFQFAAGEDPTPQEKEAADVTGRGDVPDGEVDIRDAIRVFQLVAGIIDEFPRAKIAQVVPSPVEARLSKVERSDRNLAITVTLDRLEGTAGGELILTYGGPGRTSDIQVDGLSPSGLFVINADVPGRVWVGFAEPDEGPKGKQIFLHALLPGGGEMDHFQVNLTGRFYDSWGTLVGEAHLERTVPTRPSEYVLHQNYPNPFNPSAEIRYDLPEKGHTVLEVYSLTGQLVRRLVDDLIGAGRHAIEWDGRDDRGRVVASGIYLYRLVVDGGKFTAVRRMMFIK